MLVPVLILLIAAAVAAYRVAATLRGDGGAVVLTLSVGITFWIAAAAFRTLILE